jgi:hypothetical protein
VGIVENGKYGRITEDSQLAVFFPILQSPSNATSLVVRSDLDPQQVTARMRRAVQDLDAGLPCYIQTWYEALNIALFGSHMAAMSPGVLGVMGALLLLAGVVLAMASLGLLATWIPGRRALSLDPSTLLREA